MGGDQQLRGVHGLDEAQRAAAARRDRRPARGRARLPARQGLLVRVHAASSRPTAGRWSARREDSSTRCTRRGRTSSAFSNTFSCELIERELDGEDVTELAEFYNDFYLNLFNTTAHLYRDNFQLFGNPQVMVRSSCTTHRLTSSGIGNAWCHERMRKPEDIKRLEGIVHEAIEMVPRMQQLFRDWNAIEQTPFEGVSVLCNQLAPYIQAQAEMARPAEGDETFEIAARNLRVPECARRLDFPPRGPEPARAAGREPWHQLAGDQPASGSVGGRRPVLRRRDQPRAGARDAAGDRGDGSRGARSRGRGLVREWT